MCKISWTSNGIFRGLVLVFLSACFLVGCAGTVLTPNYSGKLIKPGYQIPIGAGEGSGASETDDLRIDYQYIRSGDAIKLRGSIRFADSMGLNFNYIDYFSLGALFADSGGRILTSAAVTSASWVNLTYSNRQVQFTRDIMIHGDAVMMAFTYTGQASYGGGGGTGGGNTQFWQFPIVK